MVQGFPLQRFRTFLNAETQGEGQSSADMLSKSSRREPWRHATPDSTEGQTLAARRIERAAEEATEDAA